MSGTSSAEMEQGAAAVSSMVSSLDSISLCFFLCFFFSFLCFFFFFFFFSFSSSESNSADEDCDFFCDANTNSPQWTILHDFRGLLLASVSWDSICFITASPFTTRPNTTCFPSRCGDGWVVIKNWEPFVLGPLLAIESKNGLSCFIEKHSSAKYPP